MKTPSILVCAGVCLILAGCSTQGRLKDRTADFPLGMDSEIGTEAIGDYDKDSPEYFSNLIGNRVFFEVDQSSISPESAAILDEQAKWLMDYAGFVGVVEGHADERGTREYNLALGARRASAVRDYLVSRGVADNRLRIVTYGKERPAETCSAEQCWSQNRRSVTLVHVRADG